MVRDIRLWWDLTTPGDYALIGVQTPGDYCGIWEVAVPFTADDYQSAGLALDAVMEPGDELLIDSSAPWISFYVSGAELVIPI